MNENEGGRADARCRNRRWSAKTDRERRAGPLLAFFGLAVALAACGSTNASSPSVANVTTTVAPHGASTETTTPSSKQHDAAAFLIKWANCMRHHGDPNQSDPTIDIHGGINITISGNNVEALSNSVHNGTAPCNNYLAAASSALRAGATNLTPPDQTSLLAYAKCMRANGVPKWPDPGTGETLNLRKAGIDPNNPIVERANKTCGRQIHAPSWWISGAGPPGNVSVESGPHCSPSSCHPPGSSDGNRARQGSGTTPTTVG